MRRAAKVDRNQAEIVAALRAVGAKVRPLHTVGQGFPDVACLFRRTVYLIECKSGDEPLTDAERQFFMEWTPGPVFVARTADEALRGIGALRDSARR